MSPQAAIRVSFPSLAWLKKYPLHPQVLRQIVVERHFRHVTPRAGGRKYGVLDPIVRKTSGKVGYGKKYESKDAFFRNNTVELGPNLVARVDAFLKDSRPIGEVPKLIHQPTGWMLPVDPKNRAFYLSYGVALPSNRFF